jgi:hypothetical protein
MMRRLPLLLGGAALIAGAWACDSLANPDDNGQTRGAVISQVSGALIGDVPNNTHVTVVWRKPSGVGVLGDDGAVVDNKFTVNLAAPPDSILENADGQTTSASSGGSSSAPTVTVGAGGPNGSTESSADASAGIGTQSVKIATAVSGSTIATPLQRAIAGFIVYVDKNGNGKLDLDESSGSTTDQIIGGNVSLTLYFFKDGGNLDYVALRDGTNTPTPGFNLRLATETGSNVWVPLDQAELKLQATTLPTNVCVNVANIESGVDAGIAGQCAPDGYHVIVQSCSSQTGPSAGVCSANGVPNVSGCSYSDGGTEGMYWGYPCGMDSDGGVAGYDSGTPTYDGGEGPGGDAGF